ncbi:MAG: ATPase domain-containing protein [Candidatus Bathyarchaeota archaeon]
MSDNRRRRETSDAIEETFSRYASEDRQPQLPTIESDEPTPQGKPSAPLKEQEKPGQPSHYPTNIPGLDDLLGGGLPNGGLIQIIGTIGSGYTTFINQILINHLNNGGKAAYYTTETSSYNVQQEMAVYGWSLNRFIQNGNLVFINVLTPDLQQLAELAPESFSKLRVTLSESLTALKTDLLGKIKENRWAVLDLSHILHTYSLNEVVGLMMYWRATVRAFGGVGFAVLPSGVHDDKLVNALKNIVDGVLEFGLREGTLEYGGSLIVQKLLGMRSAKRVSYSLREEGIIVETAMRIR